MVPHVQGEAELKVMEWTEPILIPKAAMPDKCDLPELPLFAQAASQIAAEVSRTLSPQTGTFELKDCVC